MRVSENLGQSRKTRLIQSHSKWAEKNGSKVNLRAGGVALVEPFLGICEALVQFLANGYKAIKVGN